VTRELEVLLSLRTVLAEMASGRGVAGALVTVFSPKRLGLGGVARATLLGYPPRVSMKPLMQAEGPDVAMLASLIVEGAKGDVGFVGKKGVGLSLGLEKWVKAREGRRMEQNVMRFRSLIVSGVLGAVLAMVSAVGPMVGGLGFTAQSSPLDPTLIRATAGAMACLGSAMLGMFMSGRGLLLNVGATLLAFGVASAAVAPLASFGGQSLWGIK
jgi:hypothetical protein